MPRSGTFEVFIRQQWCPVSVTLNEESLTLTLTENPDQSNGNGSLDQGHGLTNGNSDLPEAITGQNRFVKVKLKSKSKSSDLLEVNKTTE